MQARAERDLFVNYPPPYDLRSDMLFVSALAPLEPFRAAFPDVPFLSVAGRAVLGMWFSTIKELCFREASGEWRCLREEEGVPYNELNVVALLRRRAIFVAGLYATSELSVRVGHAYGMPKQLTAMSFQAGHDRLQSRTVDGRRESLVNAQLFGPGRWSGLALSRVWPHWSWPARFPSGRAIKAQIQATPRLQLAHVQQGRLALEEEWLPESLPLVPLGLFAPDLRMRLPPPANATGG